MIDLEELEKAEEKIKAINERLDEAFSSLNKLLNGDETENFAKEDIQKLLDSVKSAESKEEMKKVLKKVADFLQKLLEYYPYPYYPYPYYAQPKEAKSQEESAEEVHNEDNDESSELEELRAENERLRAELEKINSQRLLEERLSQLKEVDDRDWSELSDLLLKMTDEEFNKFKLSVVPKENHSAVPESRGSKRDVFDELKKEIRGGDN